MIDQRMFKKTNRGTQVNLFGGVPSFLEGKAKKQYDDTQSWHNQFYSQIVNRIDESLFKALFSEKMGAPNAPISLLVGMMILKEAMGWSDGQLFEQSRFNLLVRCALGLININDEIPAESTYYLLRKRIYEYNLENKEDLLSRAFAKVTGDQVKEFNVNGRSIRMDSKLLGSNIAIYSRYEIIHHTLHLFYKSLDKKTLSLLPLPLRSLLVQFMDEEPQKTVFRQTREEIKIRLQSIGSLIYNLVNLLKEQTSSQYQLLRRVFDEQYKVLDEQKVELRPKEEIKSGSVQSPHDPDSTYRNKGGQKVKGYSANLTETCSDGPLNLITDVNVQPANTPDVAFVQPAIQVTEEVTGQPVEKVYADGAYQSPENDEFCQDIDMVFTGIQGAESRYLLEMATEGLVVTDTQTGELYQARMAAQNRNSTQDRWFIQTGNGRYYFDQKAIRTSELRREMRNRPVEELRKRNNVEATVFQLAYPLRNNKTKYRGLIKHQMWAVCRCFWINLVRIVNLIQQTCQRTIQTVIKTACLDQPMPYGAFFRYSIKENYRQILSFGSFVTLCLIFIQFYKTTF